MEGPRSARWRSASVQLKPSPGRRDALDLSSRGAAEELADAEDREGGLEPGKEEPVTAVDAVRRGPAREELGGYLPLPILPARASRRACAPKDTRRAKGELGVALGGVPSASSATASSFGMEPHELDMLPRRKPRLPKVEVWVGEPDRPRVVMDSRRCWLYWGLLPLPVCWVLCLEKRSLNGRLEANERRRVRFSEAGTEIGEVARSSDMMMIGEDRVEGRGSFWFGGSTAMT